ncbi:MAG: glycosyltransferase family 39 protein [Proteobacteria bacterium]|jgi:4-amino-4-deoxy-L-arabinose transferase-like glycosyltransferase|nr:glycosyltransferase family 39 protein [Pseudomonadota bacterium]
MNSASTDRQFLWLIITLIAARAVLSGWLPVMELSEARYAEIGRLMFASGDWVTPWFDEGMPFWGKPPLTFWGIAISYGITGVNEFGARLPSLVATALTASLLFRWTRTHFGPDPARTGILVLVTSLLVMHSAGAVITDPVMMLTTTGVMIFFWDAVHRQHPAAPWLMWCCLGLGLLAKGPVAPVLAGLACGCWVLLTGRWREAIFNTRPVPGALVMLLVAVPWYAQAELRTPGFFDYFIIGEHFARYTETGWQGDLYGIVKDRPFGTIWLFLIAATAPWGLLALGMLASARQRSRWRSLLASERDLAIYLLLWAFMPAIFFTPARNVLVTYVMPALPAIAVLLGIGLTVRWRWMLLVGTATAGLFLAGSLSLYHFYYRHLPENQYPIVARYLELNYTDPGPLIYTGERLFVPRFYTRGKVLFENRETRHGIPGHTFYIAIRDRWLQAERQRVGDRCQPVMVANEFTLFHCPGPAQAPGTG